MNDHVRPCNLKPQQRDLTPALRRPVEPAEVKRTSRLRAPTSESDPNQTLARVKRSPPAASSSNICCTAPPLFLLVPRRPNFAETGQPPSASGFPRRLSIKM